MFSICLISLSVVAVSAGAHLYRTFFAIGAPLKIAGPKQVMNKKQIQQWNYSKMQKRFKKVKNDYKQLKARFNNEFPDSKDNGLVVIHKDIEDINRQLLCAGFSLAAYSVYTPTSSDDSIRKKFNKHLRAAIKKLNSLSVLWTDD